jgi:hypothetical protein
MFNRFSLVITLIILYLFINGCNDTSKSETFDKTKWTDLGKLGSADKVLMAEDLIKTHKLIGLTNKQMFQLLGSPANYMDTTKTYYELATVYDVIDPVSGKNLIIQFNKDSVIISAKIEEWHKH